jgi:multiple sugar transport system permease protein
MGLLSAVLGTYMLPPVAFILPFCMAFGAFHLLNTIGALVIVYCTILLPFVLQKSLIVGLAHGGVKG